MLMILYSWNYVCLYLKQTLQINNINVASLERDYWKHAEHDTLDSRELIFTCLADKIIWGHLTEERLPLTLERVYCLNQTDTTGGGTSFQSTEPKWQKGEGKVKEQQTRSKMCTYSRCRFKAQSMENSCRHMLNRLQIHRKNSASSV